MRVLRRSTAVVGVALVAGCGGGSHRAAPPRPTLPPATAAQLAALSNGVASALDRGDTCAARALAITLRRRTAVAIGNGAVPPALRPPLRRAAAHLVVRIHCTTTPRPAQPQPHPQPPAEKEHGKGKHEHKGHKHGEGD